MSNTYVNGRGIMGSGMRSWPSLSPTYSLGSYGRTRGAILLGGNSVIGSQGRIYSYAKKRGRGEAYKAYLLNSLRGGYVYKNPWSVIQ
jgi:hypothetical protein